MRAKATTTDAVPTLVVGTAIDTTTPPAGSESGRGCLVFGAGALVVRRRVCGRWVDGGSRRFDSPAAVLDHIDSLCSPRTRVYVVCPGAADALTLLGWWRRVTDGTYTVWRRAGEEVTKGRRTKHPLIISGLPDVIGYTTARGRVRWVGCRQFGEPDVPSDLDCQPRAEWVADWITGVMSSWVGAGCGRWHDTAGAAAWATYRRHQSADRIVTHEDARARPLEDAACHGGRASIWTVRPVGNEKAWRRHSTRPPFPRSYPAIRGPLYRLDVRAMYPAIMQGMTFPTRLIGVKSGFTPARLSAALRCYMAVARVRLRTRAAEYPRRSPKGTQYPVGAFWTTLATPDLLTALVAGEVESVSQVALYERGRPFAAWGDWVLSVRRAAALHPSPHWGRYIKSVAVSLSGRLARRSGGWEDLPGHPAAREWGEWSRVNGDTGTRDRFRALSGHVQRMQPPGHRPGTLAACYAHVAAYGRVQMRAYRECAGPRQTISQHTDGLTVTYTGLSRLIEAGHVGDGEWGTLRHEGTYTHALYLGPNHFWADGKWTLAGVAAGFEVADDGTVTQRHEVNPARSAAEPVGDMLRLVSSPWVTPEPEPGGRIGADGWVLPPLAGPKWDVPDMLGGVT